MDLSDMLFVVSLTFVGSFVSVVYNPYRCRRYEASAVSLPWEFLERGHYKDKIVQEAEDEF